MVIITPCTVWQTYLREGGIVRGSHSLTFDTVCGASSLLPIAESIHLAVEAVIEAGSAAGIGHVTVRLNSTAVSDVLAAVCGLDAGMIRRAQGIAATDRISRTRSKARNELLCLGFPKDRLDRLLGYTHMGLKDHDLATVSKALLGSKFGDAPGAGDALQAFATVMLLSID